MTTVHPSLAGGGEGGPVPWHPHGGDDLSGQATFLQLHVENLLAGTIDSKEIVISGGTDGVIHSDNYVAGSAGWAIVGDGSAEFSDVTVRGVIEAGAGSTIGWDTVTAGENVASLTIGSGGALESSNFATGTSGWQIDGDGNAEFQDVTVRGVLTSLAGSSIDWGHVDNVSINSADINSLKFSKITAATNTASLTIGSGGSIKSSNFSAGSAGFRILGSGGAEFNSVTVRGTVEASSGSIANLTVSGTLTMNTSGQIRTASSGNRIEIGGSVPNRLLFAGGSNSLGIDKVLGGTGIDDTLKIGQIGGASGGDVDIVGSNIEFFGSLIKAKDVRYQMGTGGGDYWEFNSSNSQFEMVIDTNQELLIGGVGFFAPNIQTSTTGSGANVNVDGSGRLQRSTSSLEFKPDWRHIDVADRVLPKPITWTDEKGQNRIGFGAEHVHETIPEALEDGGDNYDLRSVVAVLSAKNNRLETDIADLRDRLSQLEDAAA